MIPNAIAREGAAGSLTGTVPVPLEMTTPIHSLKEPPNTVRRTFVFYPGDP
jgi:hypothetical protein